jgi:hypothetical protein
VVSISMRVKEDLRLAIGNVIWGKPPRSDVIGVRS